MATKKKTEEVVNEVIEEEVVAEEAEEEVPQGEKTVRIKLPIERGNKETHVFVSVNERTWLIEKGKWVDVPECVAHVLDLREKALDEAYSYETAKRKD